jgi:hypothetical protein
MHGRRSLALVIINQIHIGRVVAIEFENHAPVLRNPNRPLRRPVALKAMKPVTGQRYILRPARYVQQGEDLTELS